MRYLNRREQVEYCLARGLKITKAQITKLATSAAGHHIKFGEIKR